MEGWLATGTIGTATKTASRLYLVLYYLRENGKKLLFIRHGLYIITHMINSQEKTKTGVSEKELEITIDNGDLRLVTSLVEAYGFKDVNSLMKFAIGSLVQGNNNEGLFTIKTDETNKRILSKIAPSEDMLKPKTE